MFCSIFWLSLDVEHLIRKPWFSKSDQFFVSFHYLDCLSHSKSDAVLTLTRTNMSKMSLWCMCTVIKVSNFVLSIFVKFFTVCPISELRMSKNLLLVSPMIWSKLIFILGQINQLPFCPSCNCQGPAQNLESRSSESPGSQPFSGMLLCLQNHLSCERSET